MTVEGSDLTLVHVARTLIVVRPWRKAGDHTQHGCCMNFLMCCGSETELSPTFSSIRAIDLHICLQTTNNLLDSWSSNSDLHYVLIGHKNLLTFETVLLGESSVHVTCGDLLKLQRTSEVDCWKRTSRSDL